ncbi:MAG TPA: YafY family protein [Bryobacteraceae bacterium]|jgi:predicted DNA-binding transcriptional regulator YafY
MVPGDVAGRLEVNRTDRLVALVMQLQSRRVTTAAYLAEYFEVTERTIYRDLAALGEAGVPILGEAGVGYSLMRGYHLPPVIFSPDEALALLTGGLLAERMTDDTTRTAIRSALGKITAVLPAELQRRVQRLRESMQVSGRKPGAGPVPLSRLQMALADARVVQLRYRALGQDEITSREVEPLGLVFYLDQWHLIGWCRLRQDVRDFRVDRIDAVEVGHEPAPPRHDFDLASYVGRSWMPEPRETAEIEVHPRLVETVRRYWGPAILEEGPSGQGVRMLFTHAPQETGHVARWVLGLGALIRVLGPEALRDEVLVQARKALAHHAKQK